MKQTVTSKYEPKSKNVTWIDMSTGHPVQKNFINGMWRPTGGGGNGASSSNPTEADATKVWQVTPVQKGTKTEETVIVPEQTLENEQELAYNDKFVPGAQCVAVINGVEYSGEVVEEFVFYAFRVGDIGSFKYNTGNGIFKFLNDAEFNEVTAKLSVIEEVTDYDYNWAPGVKIPIPTAEDEGKILVVNKVEGDSSKEYELAPTQTVTLTEEIPSKILQNTSNLDKFIVGATVTVVVDNTISTGIVVVDDDTLVVMLDNGDAVFYDEGLLGYYSSSAGTYEVSVSILEKEYSYEYQLQENSGGGSSDVLWPAIYGDNGNERIGTFVPEDVKPGTWCMVYGLNSGFNPTCLPAVVKEFGSYRLTNASSDCGISKESVPGGELLILSWGVA